MNNHNSRLVTGNEIYSNHGILEDILYQGIHCSDFTSGWENSSSPAGNFRFKVNDRNTKTRCQICTKLTIKTPDKFEHILYLVLVFLLLTLISIFFFFFFLICICQLGKKTYRVGQTVLPTKSYLSIYKVTC